MQIQKNVSGESSSPHLKGPVLRKSASIFAVAFVLLLGMLFFASQARAVNPYNVTSTDTTTTPVSNGSASADQTSTTGLSVSVSGLTGITGDATITTSDLTGPDPGTPVVQGALVLYFDVQLTLSGSQAVPAGATAHVCFTNPGVAAGQLMEFWTGSSWASATNVSVSGTTICGDIPANELGGTNFAVLNAAGTMTQTVTSFVTNTQSSTITNTITGPGSTVTNTITNTIIPTNTGIGDLTFYGATAAAAIITGLAVFLARGRIGSY